MSPEVVDLCLEYSHLHNFPIMIIASRNQVDHDSGYAFTTLGLTSHIRNNSYYSPDRVLVCRDHCGPYFSDLDQGLDLQEVTGRCIETMLADIELGFDLIHIDVSKINPGVQEQIATTLFRVAIAANPNIMFEFGSEDNDSENLVDSLARLHVQLKFAEAFSPNLKFIVSPTGSLTKHRQVGQFNPDMAREATKLVHDAGFLFKEHNADYLTRYGVEMRIVNGIDALNVAPQLGCIQTAMMIKLGKDLGIPYYDFENYVLSQDYWKRWTTPEVIDPISRVISAGHYSFNSIQATNLRAAIGDSFIDHLRPAVFSALDEYRLGLKTNENI